MEATVVSKLFSSVESPQTQNLVLTSYTLSNSLYHTCIKGRSHFVFLYCNVLIEDIIYIYMKKVFMICVITSNY